MEKPRTIAGIGWQLGGEPGEYETISLSISKDNADYIRRTCDSYTYFALRAAESIGGATERVVGCEIAEG